MAPREEIEEKKSEQQIWEEMDPLAWHHSIARSSVFEETYVLTRNQIRDAVEREGYDVVIEAGCGTCASDPDILYDEVILYIQLTLYKCTQALEISLVNSAICPRASPALAWISTIVSLNTARSTTHFTVPTVPSSSSTCWISTNGGSP